MNVDGIAENLLDRYEKGQVASLAYVLANLRDFDSLAQASVAATGVLYACLIKMTLDRL